jgi:uncharacterized protein YlxW (UPF0749 family)
MGWAEMVVGIVLIASVAEVFKMKYRAQLKGQGKDVLADQRGSQQLRDEVRQLKERLAVLERITIEKENSLSREIEQLRDR